MSQAVVGAWPVTLHVSLKTALQRRGYYAYFREDVQRNIDSYGIEAGLETKCDDKTPDLWQISLKHSF